MKRPEDLLVGKRGGGRRGAEGWSATGDGGPAARSGAPGVDGARVRVFQSSQLKGSYVGDLLYHDRATHMSFWLRGEYKIAVYMILCSSKYEIALS